MVSAAQSEKQILWHPRWLNKFVVGGGSQMSMYEWASEQSEIRHLSSQTDLSFMKCFAWSPDPAFDDLFAVGLVSGRVELIRLESTRVARNNVLSSGPVATLPVRNSRSCNALAFCQEDPNYLAVGLDKVRGDPSLIIWDVQSCLPALSLSKASVPESDVVVARPQPRIARADVGPRTDARILQQHAPTEVVSALSFLPQSTHLLLAGMSARWLRLFDLRSPTSATTNVASKVSVIAINPMDSHQVACCGDSTVTVWDIRRFPHPLLTFAEKDAVADGARPRPGSLVHHIEFSSTRRGVLAVMEKDSAYIRFWDIRRSNIVDGLDGEQSRDSSQSRVLRRSWTNLPWTTSAYGAKQGNSEPHDPSAMVLADTRRTKHFSKPLSSFALVPNSRPFSVTTEVMVVNKEGDLELYALHDTPKQTAWSPRGDLTIGVGLSYKIFSGFQEKKVPSQPWDAMLNHGDEGSMFHGRGKQGSLTLTMGKRPGDEFPPLSTSSVGGRLATSRTYSPASFRHYPLEASIVSTELTSRGDHSAERSVQRQSGEGVRSKVQRAHGEKSSSRSRKHPSRVIQQIVEDDISMTIRRRAIRGYGIENATHNAELVQDDSSSPNGLSELWAWIQHSRELLCTPTPRLNGYDFSNQGLQGIWVGFPSLPRPSENKSSVSLPVELLSASFSTTATGSDPSGTPSPTSFPGLLKTFSECSDDGTQGNFDVAVEHLLSRKDPGQLTLSPSLHTDKMKQRQCAIQLCGWNSRDEDLSTAIKNWEKDGQYSRAACWLVFTKQYTKALELLMRSKDEMHHLMTGTLAALIPGGPKSNELREHTERLIVRLQDPYFRAMLTQMTSKDWSEVLEEEALPLRERLAIAFQFLDDRALSLYLHRTTEHVRVRGVIEGLIITGLTRPGMDILQTYVDRTGDVQTAAILSSYVCPIRFRDARAERWSEAYRDLLDGFKLFHIRVNFDVARGQILQEAVENGDLPPSFEWAPRQILIRCNYCSKSINPTLADPIGKSRTTVCPNCGRALPRCCVCLMTLSIIPDVTRDTELLNSHSTYKDTIEDAIIICQTCRHGGHASHILEWFFDEEGTHAHGMCPVAGCDCRCGDMF
ncbi:hypothetical protein V8B97DRAFT_1865454 [Scleroderma yunnanense]